MTLTVFAVFRQSKDMSQWLKNIRKSRARGFKLTHRGLKVIVITTNLLMNHIFVTGIAFTFPTVANSVNKVGASTFKRTALS